MNVGTTFRVWIPAGFDHLPRKQVRFESDQQDLSFAHDYSLGQCVELSESSQRSDENDPMQVDNNSLIRMQSSPSVDSDFPGFDNARKYVLLVDDNADMRFVQYLCYCFIQ